jgi:hypothetical protein
MSSGISNRASGWQLRFGIEPVGNGNGEPCHRQQSQPVAKFAVLQMRPIEVRKDHGRAIEGRQSEHAENRKEKE